MRSAYPSSQSFFDSTSDSIRAEDIEKCRSSASFSCLADLFTNPSRKSALFPNSKAPVCAPEEVRFPAKKKRECEERTSIWHEWGSGECRSENVAEESSGFTSDLIQGGKISVSSPSPFPNLGSANISLLTEDEYTFPARKRREEGSSWREERTSWQDWSVSAAPQTREPSLTTGSTPVVGSIQNMYLSNPCTKPFDFVTTSKSSSFSGLGAPTKSTSEEVSFPARKKREERSFWQESSLDGSTHSDCEVTAPARASSPGVGSLADMYRRKAGSSLFSKGAGSGTEEVIFPKRRIYADRNAWRDWTNTGYCDYDDDVNQDSLCVGNSFQATSGGATETGLACTQEDSSYSIEQSSRFSVGENSPASECVLRSPGHEQSRGVADAMPSASSRVQVSGPRSGLVGNVNESDCPGHQVERTMDGGEAPDVTDDILINVDDARETSYPNSASEQRRGRSSGKYPPPLRCLSRQGQSRVPTHMPWVHFRPVRTEGRFVLHEVRITQPVVFQPIRKEGRLVLQLIGQEKITHEVDARHHGNGLVAEERVVLLPNEGLKTETVVELKDVRQSLDIAERREETDRMKIIKASSAFGALAETERRKNSAKVWPVVCPPWEAHPGGEILMARTEEPTSAGSGLPRYTSPAATAQREKTHGTEESSLFFRRISSTAKNRQRTMRKTTGLRAWVRPGAIRLTNTPGIGEGSIARGELHRSRYTRACAGSSRMIEVVRLSSTSMEAR